MSGSTKIVPKLLLYTIIMPVLESKDFSVVATGWEAHWSMKNDATSWIWGKICSSILHTSSGICISKSFWALYKYNTIEHNTKDAQLIEKGNWKVKSSLPFWGRNYASFTCAAKMYVTVSSIHDESTLSLRTSFFPITLWESFHGQIIPLASSIGFYCWKTCIFFKYSPRYEVCIKCVHWFTFEIGLVY